MLKWDARLEKMAQPIVKTHVVWYNIWNRLTLISVFAVVGLIIYFFKFLHNFIY